MPERVCRNVGRTGRDGLVGLESAILRKPWTSQEEGYRGDRYRAAGSWLGVLRATNRRVLSGWHLSTSMLVVGLVGICRCDRRTAARGAVINCSREHIYFTAGQKAADFNIDVHDGVAHGDQCRQH